MDVQVPLGLANNHQKLHRRSFKTPGLSFFNLIPGGYQGKKRKKELNPWLCVWEQAGSGAFPYTFRGQNEKGRKRAKTIG